MNAQGNKGVLSSENREQLERVVKSYGERAGFRWRFFTFREQLAHSIRASVSTLDFFIAVSFALGIRIAPLLGVDSRYFIGATLAVAWLWLFRFAEAFRLHYMKLEDVDTSALKR